nr:MAG TPA: Thymidylate synthase complementing protein [Bacteriophage sp.]
MGKIIVLPETTKEPITLIGKRAGICWGADISDDTKNYNRGLDCIKSNHGRTLEYVNIELVLDGYSARAIREYYTHIAGSPTRLQASTRYINYKNFDYVIPPSVKKFGGEEIYKETMDIISENCQKLEQLGIPREDSAMLLPLGMSTKIVDKRNLRSFVDMSRQRECTRAYWEFREMFNDIKNALSELSDEWKYIIDTQFMPKCEYLGYCPEKKSCGRVPKKEDNNE